MDDPLVRVAESTFITDVSARDNPTLANSLVTIRLEVSGMTCGKCERLIREAIETELGDYVRDVSASKPDAAASFRIPEQRLRSGEAGMRFRKAVKEIEALVNGKFKVTNKGERAEAFFLVFFIKIHFCGEFL